jgi:hypothetical protein
MFEIRFDEQASILRLRLEGHWNAATFANFTATLLYQVTRLRLTRRAYVLLSDSSAFAVQSPAIAAAFDRVMQNDKVPRARAIAIVVGSTLNRLQIRHTIGAPNLRVFDNRETALEWPTEVLASPKQNAI